MAAKKNAPAAKSTPKPPATPAQPADPAVLVENPATDPTKTAQERLDALTEQQGKPPAEGTTYPL